MIHNKDSAFICAFAFLMEPRRKLWLIHIYRISGVPDACIFSVGIPGAHPVVQKCVIACLRPQRLQQVYFHYDQLYLLKQSQNNI